MGKNKNYQRVVLNLPPKTAAILEYLVTVLQVARTKSDFIVQLINEYVDKKRDVLNDNESWRKLISAFDKKKKSKVDEILDKFLPLEDDSANDEDEEN